MAQYNHVHTDFSGGLMSPHLRGRVDLDKYGKACQRLENFIPSLQGPITYRPGTKRIVTIATGKARLIPFVSGAGSNYLIVLQDREINIYDPAGEKVGTVDETDYPIYTEEELDDVNYHQEVNELHFTHPNHPPSRLVIKEESPVPLTDNTGSELTDSEDSQLFALNSGNLLELDWYFERVPFKSHPFLPLEQDNPELRVHSAVEMLRVESSDPSEFANIVFTGPDEQPRDIYLEYRVGDVWGLGRILGLNTVPSAPADPGGNQCYIEPVEKVVDIKDPSATMYPIINDGTIPALSPLLEFFGAEEGEGRVLCDTAVFETQHKNAWLRIPEDRLFTRRLPATEAAPFDQVAKYTGGDTERLPVWVKINDYVGLEDYPVDFLTSNNDVLAQTSYDSGSVYEVLRFSDGGAGPLRIWDSAGNGTAIINKDDSSTRRFTMNNTITFATLQAVGFYVANMSTQKQFDCVQFDVDGGFMFRRPKNDATSDVFVISPTGTLSVFSNRTDPLTDEGTKARHEGYLVASKAVWDSPRDIGRFVHARLDTSWVLFQIKEIISPREVFCDLFTTLPTSARTAEIENNGVFREFRMGAWYEGNWPRTVSFYERRRVYAGTPSHPNLVWLSKMENQYDFRTHEDNGEVLDTTGITYPLGTGSMRIRWMSPGATLVIGTNSGEWQLRPNEFAGAVTPENIRIAEESQIGSLPISLRIAGSVFFVDRSARALYEFYFDPQAQGFLVRTVTKLVDTLFDEDPIRRLYYQHFPHSAIWAVTQSGKMQGLVYRKEDDYYAWCTIITQGNIKDVAVLPRENNQEDQLWLLVERNDQLFLELMDDTLTTGYTDSAVTYPAVSEDDTTLFVAADFAEGDTVQVFIDDVFLGDRTVDGDGNISIPDRPDEALMIIYNGDQLVFNGVNLTYNQNAGPRKVVVGYGYQSAAQLMPFAWEMQGKLAYGQLKRLVTVRSYLHRSSSYYMGMEDFDMELLTPPQTPNYTGFDDERPIPGAQFSPEATPIIKQLRPEPLTVVSLILKFDAN